MWCAINCNSMIRAEPISCGSGRNGNYEVNFYGFQLLAIQTVLHVFSHGMVKPEQMLETSIKIHKKSEGSLKPSGKVVWQPIGGLGVTGLRLIHTDILV